MFNAVRYIVALAFTLAVFTAPLLAADRPPNIVVIFMDDMGYADIGPFGAKDYKTPNLDRMAKEGRIFSDFMVTQAVCSASRAGLLTGCYNIRVGIGGALGPNAKHGINETETTLAEICKSKGYATACYGKWHLGHHEKFLPMQHGFDDYFGLPYSNDMWPYHPGVRHLPMEQRIKRWPHLPLIDGNTVVNDKVSPDDQKMLTKQYTERAVSFIEKHKDEPFFVYLPHSMVHVPLYCSPEFEGKSGVGLFGDVMMEIDWSVGQILATLKKHGLDDNTLVVFTSDNGPWLNYGNHAGSTGGLREGKGTMFEGGCRVPTVMRWPGKIPAGTECKTPAMTIDLLPTVAHLVSAELPKHKIDGKNIWSMIAAKDECPDSPQEHYALYYGYGLEAVRMGKWKLHFPHRYRHYLPDKAGKDGIPGPTAQGKIGLALYDLDTDVNETTDVKDKHPDIIAQMQKIADTYRADLGDSLTKKKGNGRRETGRL